MTTPRYYYLIFNNKPEKGVKRYSKSSLFFNGKFEEVGF